MKIAIDLDHTLIDYSTVYKYALRDLKLNHLFNEDQIPTKEYIKKVIKEDPEFGNNIWIKFQGLCYGKYIAEALFFNKSLNTISSLLQKGYEITIVSHKTKESLCGEFPLQEVARKRIQQESLDIDIVFKSSSEEKIHYINANKFNFVIDDLESILTHVSNDTVKINFGQSKKFFSTMSWEVIDEFFDAYVDIGSPKITHVQKNIFKTDNHLYLKIFNNHERIIREKDNLEVLRDYNQVPKIIDTYTSIIITEEVKTSPLSTIDKTFNIAYKNIIERLKESKIEHKATHNVSSYFHYIDRVKERAKKIQNKTVKKQIEDYLESSLLLNQDTKLSFDYCLPDLSKKNLMNGDDNIIFFDFESAGYGSTERAFLNFIHHPENKLTIQELDVLVSTFKSTYNTNFCLKSALNIFDINYLEWCIIIYNYNSEIGIDKLSQFFSKTKGEASLIWKTKEYDFLKRKISTD